MLRRFIFTIVAAAACAGAAQAAGDSLTDRTRAFLDAYARGDEAAVMAMVEPGITAFGGDVAEVAQGREGVSEMLANDQKLWGGQARIGEIEHLAVVGDAALSAMTFDAPFTLAGRPPVMVRFSLVWRKGASGWRLAQSANATPTTGQSAAELLRKSR
ncbi:MAG TPA: nuclear transport factor 2 family protein [Phenylobacterium sp.]|jgi:ketosteroid isomerase-like protein|uniref:nuclear transport factor 2 family protein n=1 Tax=Phenylobacterium sp. TaxID=1871053 RepID=UPI002C5C1C5E|nr:nuclear transport factor 2 family protein [Phenylobacterium sp.]HXA38200.1 nuclear transport factor 2 family protein [Phenylobacterium sp.]